MLLQTCFCFLDSLLFHDLTGKACEWATALWTSQSPVLEVQQSFVDAFCRVFNYPPSGKTVSDQLFGLHQGSRSTAEFALEFRTLAAGSGWNDISLLTVFQCRLKRDLQTELACRGDVFRNLEQYIQTAIAVDWLLQQR